MVVCLSILRAQKLLSFSIKITILFFMCKGLMVSQSAARLLSFFISLFRYLLLCYLVLVPPIFSVFPVLQVALKRGKIFETVVTTTYSLIKILCTDTNMAADESCSGIGILCCYG